MTQQQLQFLLPIVIIIPVIFLRLRRMTKPQPLKLDRLWIRPAILVLIGAAVLFLPQPGQHQAAVLTVQEWGGLALAALLGGIGGWYWGRTMHIEVHPENGTLMTQGSNIAILILLLLVVVKLGLRPLLATEGSTLHLDVLLITDASIIFSVALFTVRSVEMYLRAKRILLEKTGQA